MIDATLTHLLLTSSILNPLYAIIKANMFANPAISGTVPTHMPAAPLLAAAIAHTKKNEIKESIPTASEK